MKNKHILVLSLSLLFVSSSQACQWVRSLISFVQSYVPFLKKNDIQATSEELSKEREELKKIALAENNKVKRKILEQVHKRAEPFMQYKTRFFEDYLADKEDVRQALVGGEYKRVFEDSFEAEHDGDRGQILSFFDIDDRQKTEMTKNPAHAYISIFAQFKDKNEEREYWVAHSHPSLLPCREFCKEQLRKIGLGLNERPSIEYSIYALCMALYNFRHTDKTMVHTQGYKNAHSDLAQAAFVCVNQSSFEDMVGSALVELGVEKRALQEVGFQIKGENTKKKVPAVYCMPV